MERVGRVRVGQTKVLLLFYGRDEKVEDAEVGKGVKWWGNR